MNKPTQSDIDITIDFLEWYKKYLEENEPYAKNDIRNIDAVLETLPHDMEDIQP